jgi:hypothetical protein
MSRKRIFLGVLFLLIGLLVLGIYVWGLILTSAVEGMLSATGAPATTSNNLFGQFAPVGAGISLTIALWLLVGPSVRKLLSSTRRGRSDR